MDSGNTLIQALLSSVDANKLLRGLLQKLSKEGMKIDELIALFNEITADITVPISVFSASLHPMEALCRYLIDFENLSYKNAARVLNRNEKSIWADYQRAKGKEFIIHQSQKYSVPVSIFRNNQLSIMENLISYLKQTYGLSSPQVAHLLGRSANSVAVLAKRAKSKQKGKSEKAQPKKMNMKKDEQDGE